MKSPKTVSKKKTISLIFACSLITGAAVAGPLVYLLMNKKTPDPVVNQDVYHISAPAGALSPTATSLAITQTKNNEITTDLTLSVPNNIYVQITDNNALSWKDGTTRPTDNNTTVIVTAKKGFVEEDEISVTLLAPATPVTPTAVVISDPGTIHAYYNEAGSLQLIAKDDIGGDLANPNWTIESGDDENVFSIDGNGILSWTEFLDPRVEDGAYSLVIQCVQEGLNSSTVSFDVNVKSQADYNAIPFALLTLEGNVLTGYGENDISAYNKLILPPGVTSIADSAFEGCSSLISADLSNLTTGSIGDNAFKGCSSLTTLDLSVFNGNIGTSAFDSCYSLLSLDFPSLTTGSIGDGAFANCTSIIEVYLENYNNDIGDYAFENCNSLTYISLSNLKTGSIGNGTFVNCTSLGSVYFHSTFNGSIGDNAFYNCTSLSYIQLSGMSSGSIGNYAFQGCSSLPSIDLSNLTTGSIGDFAFSDCSSLTDLDISNMTSGTIGDFAFSMCNLNINRVKLPFGSGVYNVCETVDNAMLIQKQGTAGAAKKIAGSLAMGSFTWSELSADTGWNSIDDFAFAGCSSLTSINLSGITTGSIGDGAFISCFSLESVDLSSLTTGSIGTGAFQDCTSLSSIALPLYEGNIPNYAFQGCSSLPEIDLPALTSVLIGDYAFESCSSLTAVKLPNLASLNPSDVGIFSFSNCPLLDYIDLSKMLSIGDYAFANCTSLTSAVLTSVVDEEIGYSAFSGCTSLSWLNLSNLTTGTIGDNAFAGCSSLTQAYTILPTSSTLYDVVTSEDASTIPQGKILIEKKIANVTPKIVGCLAIGDFALSDLSAYWNDILPTQWQAFDHCASITSVDLSGVAQGIPYGTFENCSSLESVKFSSNFNSNIGNNAFFGCTSLASLDLSSMTTATIGTLAFAYCDSLATVNLSGLTSGTISGWAFQYCTSLTTLDISSLTADGSLESYAFLECNNLSLIKIAPFDDDDNPLPTTNWGSDIFDNISRTGKIVYTGTLDQSVIKNFFFTKGVHSSLWTVSAT